MMSSTNSEEENPESEFYVYIKFRNSCETKTISSRNIMGFFPKDINDYDKKKWYKVISPIANNSKLAQIGLMRESEESLMKSIKKSRPRFLPHRLLAAKSSEKKRKVKKIKKNESDNESAQLQEEFDILSRQKMKRALHSAPKVDTSSDSDDRDTSRNEPDSKKKKKEISNNIMSDDDEFQNKDKTSEQFLNNINNMKSNKEKDETCTFKTSSKNNNGNDSAIEPKAIEDSLATDDVNKTVRYNSRKHSEQSNKERNETHALDTSSNNDDENELAKESDSTQRNTEALDGVQKANQTIKDLLEKDDVNKTVRYNSRKQSEQSNKKRNETPALINTSSNNEFANLNTETLVGVQKANQTIKNLLEKNDVDKTVKYEHVIDHIDLVGTDNDSDNSFNCKMRSTTYQYSDYEFDDESNKKKEHVRRNLNPMFSHNQNNSEVQKSSNCISSDLNISELEKSNYELKKGVKDCSMCIILRTEIGELKRVIQVKNITIDELVDRNYELRMQTPQKDVYKHSEEDNYCYDDEETKVETEPQKVTKGYLNDVNGKANVNQVKDMIDTKTEHGKDKLYEWHGDKMYIGNGYYLNKEMWQSINKRGRSSNSVFIREFMLFLWTHDELAERCQSLEKGDNAGRKLLTPKKVEVMIDCFKHMRLRKLSEGGIRDEISDAKKVITQKIKEIRAKRKQMNKVEVKQE